MLPRVEAELEGGPAGKEQAVRQGSETVLLVEDDDVVRELSHRVLEMNGYRVIEASRASEALELLTAHRGDIHLLVTDVVMPFMSGGALAERAVALRPTMRVLFISGYTDDTIVHHGVLDRRHGFLQKPFTPNALARKVREVLDEARR
jgi:DNA-binding NtrC family response regulator